MPTPPTTSPTRVSQGIKQLPLFEHFDTETPTAKLHAQKIAMPPTPPSEKPPASSLALPSSSIAAPSSPTSGFQTPRERRSISNRFWEKNAAPSTDGARGISLASDSSDSDDSSEAANIKTHNRLESNIKRLLALETGPVRLKTLSTNETVREYTSLLDAFAHKPKTQRKRKKATDALQAFLEEHDQIVEVYNQYARLDRRVCKDRVLPEFEVYYPPESKQTKDSTVKDSSSDVRRAPAKHGHAHTEEDDSDAEGIVTQTVRHGEDFDAPSVFNTRGVSVPSIFNRKSGEMAEKNQRRFLLYRRDAPLKKNDEGVVRDEGRPSWDEEVRGEGTPTRPGKKRKVA
ncbi:uncharacterized protein N0V89_000058 [Didymosphaeria variabile]|uniref:Uncharacterized protein n=1 Tax=Didymosphaeria variabile TaxID=1932322 RepID=A0A9W8XTZ4_9PLEO|nr:uncharacterized protein N0V89_000058 [Didymosphaeria variabile]KAJ4359503.1 hypothetical protein N0V89_000058 [Didymosphaeria variabile]